MAIRRLTPTVALIAAVAAALVTVTAVEPAVAVPSTGTVSGMVTSSGRPVAGAHVTLVRSGRATHFCSLACSTTGEDVRTDRAGRYTLRSVPNGAYAVQADTFEAGDATSYSGGASSFESARQVTVAGRTVAGIDVQIAAEATVSGDVVAADGTATRGSVRARLWAQYRGHWHVMRDASYDPGSHAPSLPQTQTVSPFTVGRVAAGTYRLQLVPEDSDTTGTVAGWWGGTSLATARSFTVAAGQHLDRMDVTVGSTTATPADASTLIAGKDVWSTSVGIVQRGVAEGVYAQHGTVFVVSGQYPTDGLSVVPAAARHHFPMLLTPAAALPSATRAELVALAPAKVVLVGGTASVSANVLRQVHSAVPRAAVSRIDGRDRYEANRRVNDAFFPGTQAVATFVVGTGTTDLLAAVPAAGTDAQPVVLLRPGTHPDAATRTFLRAHHVDHATLVGSQKGTSPDYLADLSTAGVSTIDTVLGPEPGAVSAGAATKLTGTADTAYLVSAKSLPDGLAAAALAGSEGAAVLQSSPTCLQASVAQVIGSLGVHHVVRIGGPSSLSAGMATLPRCR